MNLKLYTTLLCIFACAQLLAQPVKNPNVILIITDDQGYGDLGVTGNLNIHTPVIDRFANENVSFENFYVSPVCAPTRSSLMTGRYSLRTGMRDTYNGGATMHTNEVTIAEMLKQANYKTGAFGKWHLGDNYPSRPNDQGFDESVIHLSGGMGQVGDITTYFKGNRSYFDPVLWHNGQQEDYTGYCSDIFTSQAIRFIEENKAQPFFCYLAFNAPHTPLQVPDSYYQKYKDIDPTEGFEDDDRPFPKMTERDKESARKVYAMVENIDDNLGRLFKKLDDLKIADNTLIIFMTDNGPQQYRYVGGMRGKKASVYRGGVRVPFFMKMPKGVKTEKQVATTAAHIDILPTLAEICNAEVPADRKIDGKSLVPLLKDEKVEWADRPLFFYWTRRYPELYNNMALQQGKYRLVGHTNFDASISDFELFDFEADPYEQINLVEKQKDLALQLKAEMDKQYEELINSNHLQNPQPIQVGTAFENPIFLNRNDADGERGIWAQEEIYGKWHVHINKGKYNIRFKFIKPLETAGTMYFEAGAVVLQKKATPKSTDIIEWKAVKLPEGECELIPFYSTKGKKIMPFWVELEKIED